MLSRLRKTLPVASLHYDSNYSTLRPLESCSTLDLKEQLTIPNSLRALIHLRFTTPAVITMTIKVIAPNDYTMNNKTYHFICSTLYLSKPSVHSLLPHPVLIFYCTLGNCSTGSIASPSIRTMNIPNQDGRINLKSNKPRILKKKDIFYPSTCCSLLLNNISH